jgi:MFS family permease
MLVAACVVVTDRPAAALIFAAVTTLFGTAWIARLPVMRHGVRHGTGFAWLLAAVSASFLVLALMPNPWSLGVALVIGGAAIAPALTVGNNLVGRIAPAAMLNEAFTWVVTVSVGCSAAGGAVAGAIVDQPGGLPWAFVLAAGVLPAAALIAAIPAGPMTRADQHATDRLRSALAAEPA